MIKINEIFFSIQGESRLMGWPTLFIRTSGCHLRCDYCDTTYAYHEGKNYNLNELIEKIQSYSSRHVCITGGEPLLQKKVPSLLTKLCDLNYMVSLETCGDIDCLGVDSRVLKVIDVKTPDSGAFGAFCLKNLNLPNVNTEFKFVICSEKDFYWAEEYTEKYPVFKNNNVLYSPAHEKISAQWLAEKILTEKSKARLQLQLHKYIWSPNTKGV